MVRLVVSVFCLAVLLTSGCGTVVNLSRLPGQDGGMKVYGGVAIDLENAETRYETATKTPPRTKFGSMEGNQCGLILCDVPLSFLGDTLTLPLALIVEAREERKQIEKSLEPVEEKPPAPPPAPWPPPGSVLTDGKL